MVMMCCYHVMLMVHSHSTTHGNMMEWVWWPHSISCWKMEVLFSPMLKVLRVNNSVGELEIAVELVNALHMKVRPKSLHMNRTVGIDENGPYAKLFKIINFKGAGGPMLKTCQCAPYIAVMTISEFEPHSRFHS